MSFEVAEADRRIANIIRVGKVASVDTASATAVVNFGDLPSPPLPVGQLSAGAIQFWWMPSVGEQVLVACEGGDIAQGKIVCSFYANNAPSSDGAVPKINLAGGKMIIDGTLEITTEVIVPKVTAQQVTAEEVTADGVRLTNHTHSNVANGDGNSGTPNR